MARSELPSTEKSRSRDVSPIAHEKQHIRTMFIKFLQSALQG